MADKENAQPEQGRVEVGFASDSEDRIDLTRGEPKGKITSSVNTQAGVEFDAEGVHRTGVNDLLDDPEEADQPEGGEEAPDDGDKAEGDESAPESPPEDLGEWKADDPEVAAKFDERYFGKDGTELNVSALSDEVAANLAKEDGKPVLNEGTYGWLRDRMGVSKEAVDRIIAGQVALRTQNEDAFYGVVGGKDLYAQKLEWAKGVYTPAQKERFNAAIAAGGEEAQEALELLNTRWEKAGNKAPDKPTTEQARKIGLPPKRPASPAKTTAAATTGGGSDVKPFANADEHRKAMADAMKSGDKGQLDLVRKRLVASPWFRA